MEHQWGSIYHIACDDDPEYAYIGATKWPQMRYLKNTVTCDNQLDNVINEDIYIKQKPPTMNQDQGYYLPSSTTRSFCPYLDKYLYNEETMFECVIGTCSWQAKTTHRFNFRTESEPISYYQ